MTEKRSRVGIDISADTLTVAVTCDLDRCVKRRRACALC